MFVTFDGSPNYLMKTHLVVCDLQTSDVDLGFSYSTIA